MHLSEFYRYWSCFQCYCSGGFLGLNPDVTALPCSLPGATLSALLRQELLTLGSTSPLGQPAPTTHPLCKRAGGSSAPGHQLPGLLVGTSWPLGPLVSWSHDTCSFRQWSWLTSMSTASAWSPWSLPLACLSSRRAGGGRSATAGSFRPAASWSCTFLLVLQRQWGSYYSGLTQQLVGATVGLPPK